MRPSPLLLAAALLIAGPAALSAADSDEVSPTASSPAATSTQEPVNSPATPAANETAPAQPAAAEAVAAAEVGTPAAPQPAPATSVSDAAAPASQSTAAPTPQVVTAQIDPELALRLSLLEKAMLAQTQGQSAIYSETSRLLMFFGSACVGMGLVAMIAAVFLMNRTLASVSAITAQVTQGQSVQALPAHTTAALAPAGSASPTGFDKVQASGQRFQSRMTSLEQRLEELEHLAGHGSPAPTDGASESTEPVAAVEPPPRRVVPVSGILVRKAETLMNLNKLEEAMAALDEAARHEGDQSEVHLARGRVQEKLGRLGDALQSYDRAVNQDETNTAALLMKAGVLNRQERFDEALSCYERALAVHRTQAAGVT